MKFDPSTLRLDFKLRRALVTGAGKGIGREIALMLKRFNAQVVAVSRTDADLKVLQKEIGCETIVADLGNASEAQRMAEQAEDIDLLVNNAAIAIWNLCFRRKLNPGMPRCGQLEGSFDRIASHCQKDDREGRRGSDC